MEPIFVPAPFRMPEPARFGGRHYPDVREWIDQVENYFVGTNPPEHMKVPYAAALFQGDALIWWRHLKIQGRLPTEWDTFKNEVIIMFQPINSVKHARDKLADLRQRRSVQEYAVTFRSLAMQIPGITEEELIDKFIRGLKVQTRKEIEYKNPPTLNEAVREAERYDAVYFRNREHRPEFNVRASTSREAHSGPRPMEIDAIQRHKKLDENEKERLRKSGSCFFCREKGHIAQACPKKSRNTQSSSEKFKSRC
ncbi:uncharacterized protein VTP21DRAFT_10257 [Calcarisporiella thermophila]|uniref:uncharacterized protein n=1 Tax=Calcarisporiella thermophila TaxID=911321 RepID=UPI00374286E3